MPGGSPVVLDESCRERGICPGNLQGLDRSRLRQARLLHVLADQVAQQRPAELSGEISAQNSKWVYVQNRAWIRVFGHPRRGIARTAFVAGNLWIELEHRQLCQRCDGREA